MHVHIGKFSDIRSKLQLTDDKIYFYTVNKDGSILLRKANDYELLACRRRPERNLFG